MTNDERLRDRSREFHLQEWQALHEEVNANAEEMRDTERNVVIACMVIWSWIIGKQTFFYWPALMLPVAASIIGALRVEALSRADTLIGSYLRRIESEYALPTMGWELHFRGPSSDLQEQHRVGHNRRSFWWIMSAASAIISALVTVYLHRMEELKTVAG